jgi:hypothetical protein
MDVVKSYYQTIQARHADVQKDQVGEKLASFLDGFGAVFRFAADFSIAPGGASKLITPRRTNSLSSATNIRMENER